MSAPAVHIPSPRRPLGAAPATPSVPAPRAGLVERGGPAEGRHRRREDHVDVPAPRRDRPRSTSPQAPGIPAPRPAAPGSSACPPVPAPRHPAAPAPRSGADAGRPAVPASRPIGSAVRPRGTTPVQPHADVAAARRGTTHGATGRPSAAGRTLDLLGRVGSITTIAAMLVVSAALAGLADGNPPTGTAAEVAVTTLR